MLVNTLLTYFASTSVYFTRVTPAGVESNWPGLFDWYASDRAQKFMWQPSTQTNYQLSEAGQMGVRATGYVVG